MRQRVFRNHYHGPYVVIVALLGVTLGIVAQMSVPVLRVYFPRAWALWPWAPSIIPLVGTAVVVLTRRDCPHTRWRFAMCGAVSFCSVAAMTIADPFNGAPRPSFVELAGVVGAAAIVFIPLGGLLGVGLWRLRDLIFGAPLIQDGSYCPHCAYTIHGLPEPRCPECGLIFDENDLDTCPDSASKAWVRVGSIGACALLIAGGAFVALPRLAAYGLFRCASSPSRAFACQQVFGSYLELRPIAAAEVLGEYLGDDDAETRAVSANTLMWFPSCPLKVRLLLRSLALSDPVARVRLFAIQTIGRIAPSLLESMMEDLLADPSRECRRMAFSSHSLFGSGLTNHSKWATPYLIRALDDADAANRGFLYRVLTVFTGESFPFTAAAPRSERLAQQAVWREWWEKRTAVGSTDGSS